MKKRAFLILTSLVAVSTLINHLCLRTAFFGLAAEIEKLLILAVMLVFCLLYLRRQVAETFYSYSFMSNLGIVIFLICCFVFQAYRLFFDFHAFTLEETYMTVLDSFSRCIAIMLPLALVTAVTLIISNIFLISYDGARWVNTLGIALGGCLLVGSLVCPQLNYIMTKYLTILPVSTQRIFYFSQVFWCLIVAYFECMMWAAIICTLIAARHWPRPDQDFLIVLGCKVDKNGWPLPILQERLERALEFARAQSDNYGPELTYILSGGQGSDEVNSEAEGMRRFLVAKNVSNSKIVLEDRSKTTQENMHFSKQIIDERAPEAKVVFVTNGFHVWRSGVLAVNEGIKAEGIGAHAPWYFYNNALVREFIANLAVQWQQHLINIGIIFLNVSLVIGVGCFLNIL